MSEARLVLDLASVSCSGRRPAIGVLYLEMSGVLFPSLRWTEFVVVFLEAWLTAVTRLVRRKSGSERVYFMEGPFCVDLRPVGADRIEVVAIERPESRVAMVSVATDALVKDAVGVAEAVLPVLRDLGCWSRDCEHLVGALRLLVSIRPKAGGRHG